MVVQWLSCWLGVPRRIPEERRTRAEVTSRNLEERDRERNLSSRKKQNSLSHKLKLGRNDRRNEPVVKKKPSLTTLWRTENSVQGQQKSLITFTHPSFPLKTEYPRHRENRENGPKKSLSRKIQGMDILSNHWENTGNLFCSSFKFPNSKGKRYFDTCREDFEFFVQGG